MGSLLVQVGFAVFCLGLAMTVGAAVAKKINKIAGWVVGIAIIAAAVFIYGPVILYLGDV